MNFPAIYLASASPRRHDLLLQIGIEHQMLDVPSPPGEDEPVLHNEAPSAYVRRTARDKALRALEWIDRQALPPRAVLTADTTVILDQAVLGKPADLADAARMLAQLSGRTHEVHTAIVLACDGRIHEDISITQVRFKTLSPADIDGYCRTGEPLGKAGSYGIQGAAAVFVEHISGSYTGVMGLPLFETHRLLAKAGLHRTEAAR
jgi:septum formation protein